MSGMNMTHMFDDDILGNMTNILLSTLVQEDTTTTTTSRPYTKPTTMPTTTMSSTTTTTTTTPLPTTIIQKISHAVVTSTYNFTDFMDTNGTWTDAIPGNGSIPTARTPRQYNGNLSNLDLIWIVPIMILTVLFLLGLGFLLFYCIKGTELCFLRYCRCCFSCCKCCSKTSYLLRDEHAKLTDDDTNVLYMREMRNGRSRPK